MDFKFLMEISYCGSNYGGWQYQPNRLTVQEVVEDKLSHLYKSKVAVKASGRTDAGVHAVALPVIFAPPISNIPENKVKKALNNLLPDDIHIRSIKKIYDKTFDPRFDAIGKAYTYIITPRKHSPFIYRYCWHIKHPFSIEKIKESTRYLIGKYDFSSFAVEINKSKKDPIREIYRIDIDEIDEFICITFIGNSFLYKMVRSIIGTIVECSKPNKTPLEIKKILKAKDRSAAYNTAPPNGLFLMKVFYSEKDLHYFKLEQLPFLH